MYFYLLSLIFLHVNFLTSFSLFSGCPGGANPNRECLVNPCRYLICKAFPNAQCEVDACDSCKPRYTVGITEVTTMCSEWHT